MKLFAVVKTGLFALSLTACSSQNEDRRTTPLLKIFKDIDNSNNNHKPSRDNYIVQGKWKINISTIENTNQFLIAEDDFPVTSTVAPSVQFTVDDSGFSVPSEIVEGDIDFGQFSLNQLRDNKMRVCGAGGSDRCTEAAIRVYTQGAPGSGFWHSVDEYGAPIKASSIEVGLDAADAAIVATYAIPTRKRVVKLKDFTGANNTPLLIPISVNFDDAGAGDYSSTIVVEYVLR
jgi:hypothetical protein